MVFTLPIVARSFGMASTTPAVLSATAAACLIASAHPPVIIDARPAGLHAVERVRGAIRPPTAWGNRTSGLHSALVYDCGSTSLNAPYSRGAAELRRLQGCVSDDVSLYLVEGGLPAVRAVAPHLVTRPVDAKLPPHIARFPWAVRAFADTARIAAPPARVLPSLFVGSVAHATDPVWLRQHGVTHVLAVGDEFHSPPSLPSVEWLCLPARDSPDEELARHFGTAIAFLDAARAHRGVSVVHCQAGSSRSVAIVVAYLIFHAWSLNEALHHVKCLRPAANPNPGFMAQLSQWQILCTQNPRHANALFPSSICSAISSGHVQDNCFGPRKVHYASSVSTSMSSPRRVVDIDFETQMDMRPNDMSSTSCTSCTNAP